MPHAVVTGTSSGIGQAIARRLLDGGWRVTGFDRAPPTLDHAAFKAVTLDITDATARSRARRGGRRHRAGACAGIMRGGTLGSLDLAAGETLWRLHVEPRSRSPTGSRRASPRRRIVLIGSRRRAA